MPSLRAQQSIFLRLPRRCAPRNDGLDGLPRRCAPRNDGSDIGSEGVNDSRLPTEPCVRVRTRLLMSNVPIA